VADDIGAFIRKEDDLAGDLNRKGQAFAIHNTIENGSGDLLLIWA
jgi:hypothetical protein